MTQFLDVDQVIAIHDRRSSTALLDRGRLESAVAQPQLELLGGYAYESLFLQAAVLLHRIAMGHAFEDGNKRTAWVATVAFLELKGVTLSEDLSQAEVVEFMVSVVADHREQGDVAAWLEAAASTNELD